jgi:hypothetical protein
MLKKALNIFSCMLLLSGCSSMGESGGDESYPKSREERESDRVGKLTGDEGIVLSGGKRKSSATEGINVNSYLWRAALDVVHKMPLLSADPFGGTILTDWYTQNGNQKERFKLNIFIIGAELRSDAVKVSAFKQVLSNGNWIDAEVSDQLASQIEDKILLSARSKKFTSPN